MRWLAIVNPHSGGNRNCARLEALVAGLQRLAVKTVFTRYPGDAVEVAMKAQAYDGIAAVGGDGTLFEILKGINRKEQRLAVIPAGRGNSLARDMGLLRRRELFDVLHWEEARIIDLLEVNMTTADGITSTHLSASTVAIGYPAAVALRARQLTWLGRMSYAVAAGVIQPTHFRACVQYENGIARVLRLSGFIANNTRHLANFMAFHQGSCSDGLFEIMEMNAKFAKQSIHNLSALSGTRAYEPYLSMQIRSAQLRLETPQNLMIDGEIFPDVISLDVKILPSALACNGAKTK
jgi:diacylglycerol kinase (ATP)